MHGLKCGSCSACCQAIGISGGMPENPEGKEFFQANWVPITREQAVAVSPNLAEWPSTTEFFKCLALVDGKCSKYDERPRVCSEFPYYLQPVDTLGEFTAFTDTYWNPYQYGHHRCRLIPEMIPVVNVD